MTLRPQQFKNQCEKKHAKRKGLTDSHSEKESATRKKVLRERKCYEKESATRKKVLRERKCNL